MADTAAVSEKRLTEANNEGASYSSGNIAKTLPAYYYPNGMPPGGASNGMPPGGYYGEGMPVGGSMPPGGYYGEGGEPWSMVNGSYWPEGANSADGTYAPGMNPFEGAGKGYSGGGVDENGQYQPILLDNKGESSLPAGSALSSGGMTQNHEYPFADLMAALDQSRYTQKGADALSGEARSMYDPIYSAERQGLAHQAEQNALQLEQELRGLDSSYDRAREDTAKSFADAYSQTGNAMLARGMQRSSYGQQIQSNIQIAGGRAQQDINQQQANAETKIRETASMYDRQFRESLTRLAADYETNVTNYRTQLEQREYDRYWQSQQAMNNLNLAIYQASLTEAQFNESMRQFNTQLAENQRQFDLQMRAEHPELLSSGMNGMYGFNPGMTESSAVSQLGYNSLIGSSGGSSESSGTVITSPGSVTKAPPKKTTTDDKKLNGSLLNGIKQLPTVPNVSKVSNEPPTKPLPIIGAGIKKAPSTVTENIKKGGKN
ncbi:hypothetical protein AGMMS49992_31900 [Clostridia bacterium]|nr:hypothetical protein AGMMS49992_31900 [Clostridia bacterium]